MIFYSEFLYSTYNGGSEYLTPVPNCRASREICSTRFSMRRSTLSGCVHSCSRGLLQVEFVVMAKLLITLLLVVQSEALVEDRSVTASS